ncbi:MAG: 4-hydroxy-3-methylbut-2-enyl diphosphate reductase [Chloroflexota bacterium]
MRVLLAGPRGYCAGVSRAVEIVDRALEIFSPPIYVKHEIIHNHHVVQRLRSRGVVFIEDVSEAPGNSVLIFSAHGVPPSDRIAAVARGLTVIDATCPLVTKVHLEAIRYAQRGYFIVYIGHRGHPEPLGTLGEIDPEHGTLIEGVDEVVDLEVPNPERVVALTQTTLAVDDVRQIIERLRERFPLLEVPPKEDICYATTNRQSAVKALAEQSDLVLVIGSRASSNSNRLVEVARVAGCKARLVESPEDISAEWLTGIGTVGISSGASTPEDLVEDAVLRLQGLGATRVENLVVLEEAVHFPLPIELESSISR